MFGDFGDEQDVGVPVAVQLPLDGGHQVSVGGGVAAAAGGGGDQVQPSVVEAVADEAKVNAVRLGRGQALADPVDEVGRVGVGGHGSAPVGGQNDSNMAVIIDTASRAWAASTSTGGEFIRPLRFGQRSAGGPSGPERPRGGLSAGRRAVPGSCKSDRCW